MENGSGMVEEDVVLIWVLQFAINLLGCGTTCAMYKTEREMKGG